MFDSPGVNVVIGLTLIYLLYSLLASILSEMLATSLNLRSVLLRVALERMLNDGYYARRNRWHNGWNNLVNAVRWLLLLPNRHFKSSLAGRFYEHPSIKYLAKVERRSLFAEMRPAYITDVYFVSTLIRMLIEMGLGADDKERIASALQLNTLHMQRRTAENIRSIYREAGGDTEAFKEGLRKWYNETMDRTNGWYKRKMQALLLVLGLVIAMVFNIDSIRIAKLLARDPQAREQLVAMSIAIAKDTAIEKTVAANDSAHRAAILDAGYAHLQRDISDARLVLGMGWNFNRQTSPVTYNVDSALRKQVYEWNAAAASVRQADSELRVKAAKDRLAVKTLEPEIKHADREITDAVMTALERNVKDTGYIDSLRQKSKRLQQLLAARKTVLANDSAELRSLASLQQHNLYTINQLTGEKFTGIPALVVDDKKQTSLQGPGPFSGCRLWYIFTHTLSEYRWLGFLLTALMLSLGAPFWFDLLKKLVNLRGAGVRPEPTETAVVAVTDPLLPAAAKPAAIVPTPVIPLFANVQDEFVWKYRAGLMALPQVRAVFSYYDRQGECRVQVNVTGAAAGPEIRKLLAKLGITDQPEWLKVVVSGIPVSHVRELPPHSVGNRDNIDIAYGSLSCILKDATNKDKFVLSCWHVLRGDTRLDAITLDHPTIVDDRGSLLAELEAGGILDTLDYGLARCTPEASVQSNQWLATALKLPAGLLHRPIVAEDAKSHCTLRFYDVIKEKVVTGVLYTVCEQVQIDYDDRSRIVQDVLVLMKDADTELPVSQPGNSGALLFDKHHKAVGMIIAGDDHYTYAIKLSNFFNLHKEKSFA